jgi:hypothetical protein
MAEAKDSDMVPLPWRNMQAGGRLLVEHLVGLGVMPMPAGTDMMSDVMQRARIACREWATPEDDSA